MPGDRRVNIPSPAEAQAAARKLSARKALDDSLRGIGSGDDNDDTDEDNDADDADSTRAFPLLWLPISLLL